MEWIQRNPRKAAGLAGLLVLVLVALVWGGARADGKKDPATLGGAPLATPTLTPGDLLTATPSAIPTSQASVLDALSSQGDSVGSGASGNGSVTSLTPHHVVLTAGSNGPLMAVGWWIPLADGQRKGSDTSHSRTFRHADTTYGDRDFAQLLAFGSSTSRRTWCTITVDGRVVDHQEGRGPWARVFCRH